jgi:hypothetical protein
MSNSQLAHALSQARQDDLRRAAECSRHVALVRPARPSLIARLQQILSRAPHPAQPAAAGMVPTHAGR